MGGVGVRPGRLFAAQDLQHADVADARCRRDLAQRMSSRLCVRDRGTVFGFSGSAPSGGALHASKRLHSVAPRVRKPALIQPRGVYSLPERGNGLGGVRVVQRDGDAEFAGFVAERGVLTLLPECLCIGHAGNNSYRYGFVKGDE